MPSSASRLGATTALATSALLCLLLLLSFASYIPFLSAPSNAISSVQPFLSLAPITMSVPFPGLSSIHPPTHTHPSAPEQVRRSTTRKVLVARTEIDAVLDLRPLFGRNTKQIYLALATSVPHPSLPLLNASTLPASDSSSPFTDLFDPGQGRVHEAIIWDRIFTRASPSPLALAPLPKPAPNKKAKKDKYLLELTHAKNRYLWHASWATELVKLAKKLERERQRAGADDGAVSGTENGNGVQLPVRMQLRWYEMPYVGGLRSGVAAEWTGSIRA